MTLEQFTNDEEQVARRYEYDDQLVFVVDFGAAIADSAVDVVDGTVLAVLDGTQYEIELPEDADDAHTFIKNGVLTIEVEGDR
ncbi:uncharacterized protein Nmag_0404 [Natrialba magadii ATCC 43099]|uniref:Hsp20/alpha crystallin family protein n=1 Tax=Natrialba magadii (strain ATCC 43099 / DSM 3394 / CCM 3739 / CIP 104546 / IAM 13178 / JCM 8861 / NBRC 102185 / NCIMB 2190 / MS3) TaxID=547559 RepID=D3SXV2_NATMM|nr:hypothetical protein [Natrialba magadii]ADD03992.1 uncharacterized protein Nmag_0404 [Natrialba magadii ATCC 43099]ELY33149.1 hypothetical protein C500_02434 [Natrialba magadii ATCC 43099]